MEKSKWLPLIYRVLAVANFLFGALGILFMADSVRYVALVNTNTEPYFVPAYLAMIAANICFLGLLVFAAICLLRLKPLGVVVCNALFVAEILYFLAIAFLWTGVFSKAIAMSVAGATGVGNMGLSPQLQCGYPLIALLSLNLARWCLVDKPGRAQVFPS